MKNCWQKSTASKIRANQNIKQIRAQVKSIKIAIDSLDSSNLEDLEIPTWVSGENMVKRN